MSDSEKIAQLEARIAQLEARLAAIEFRLPLPPVQPIKAWYAPSYAIGAGGIPIGGQS